MRTVKRRDFLGGAIAACAASLPALGQGAPRDGRAPLTMPQLEALVRGQLGGKLTCVRTPESVDGPYYSETSLQRRAIAEGERGLRMRLGITVANALMEGSACAPLAGAIVDVWQANADGVYSNVITELQGRDTTGQTFLRGHQVTDQNGYVEFDTLVPGWYLGPMPEPVGVIARAPHVHVKVFLDHKIVTTQLYFPDRFLEDLYRGTEPYSAHRSLIVPGGSKRYDRIQNREDMVFVADKARPMSIERQADGVRATATIGLVTLGSEGFAPLFR